MVDNPELTEKRGPGRPKNAEKLEASPELIEMLMSKITEMQAANAAQTLELVESLRKPTELEQKKLDEDKDKVIKQHAMSVKIAAQQERMKRNKEAACNHSNKDGTLFRAQLNSDGYFIPICIRCQKQTSPIKAAAGRQAIEMHQWNGVTPEALENMAKLSLEQPV